MNKGLEALKHLEDRANHDEYLFREDTNREKAVAFLEDNESYVSTIEKELQALEILKAKLSPLAKSTFLPMTQEEFNLLNEVLNDEHR